MATKAKTQEIVPVVSFFDLILESDAEKVESALKSAEAHIDELEAEAEIEVTEENLADFRTARAKVNAERTATENARKSARKALLKRHDDFNPVYQKRVIDKYDSLLSTMDEKIKNTEQGIKSKKEDEIKDYFAEYAASIGVTYYSWKDYKNIVKIGLSDSVTALKRKCKGWLDQIKRNYELCMDSEWPEEAIVELKANEWDGITAVGIVKERHRRQEEEAERLRQQEEYRRQMQALEEERIRIQNEEAAKAAAAAAKMEEPAPERDVFTSQQEVFERAIEAETVSAPVEMDMPEEEPVVVVEEEQNYQLTFTVRAPLDKLRALKSFLIDNNYEIVE